MRRKIDPAQGQLMSMQPTDARTGVEIAAAKVSGKWAVKDNAGNTEIAKGVTCTIDGWLRVHLVDSWNNNTARETANRVYRDVPVYANQMIGYVFDEIDVDNSTAGLFLNDGNSKPQMLCWL
jgi:hypothetical protein